ncbi:MAG: hypothetical protein J6C17_03015 [Clostridia bacterium]|nr:hypothetical protein [Clostridia bacterium]
MKKVLVILTLVCSLLFSACGKESTVAKSGGKPFTKNYETISDAEAEKYFDEHYVDERKLPVLDFNLERRFVSGDRCLEFHDSVENPPEAVIYEYYRNCAEGDYETIKDMVLGENLKTVIKNDEKSFKEGRYLSYVRIEDVDLVDRDDFNKISSNHKKMVINLLEELNVSEFAIVEVEKTIKLSEKLLNSAPQIGDGEAERFYLLGLADGGYKICEIYWEGFIRDI